MAPKRSTPTKGTPQKASPIKAAASTPAKDTTPAKKAAASPRTSTQAPPAKRQTAEPKARDSVADFAKIEASLAAVELGAEDFPEDILVVSDAEGDDGDVDGVAEGAGADLEDGQMILFPGAEDLVQELKSQLPMAVEMGTFQDAADESDSSEDEAFDNRVGDIPLEWYKDEDHIGYDVEGRKLMKKERTALQELLDKTDDPNAYRTIYDALHDEKKVLSNAELEMIFNLQRNRTPNSSYDMYADYAESKLKFDPLNHPLARPNGPSKKTFVPKLHEMKTIAKMVKRLLKGIKDEPEEDPEDDPDKMYMLWDDTTNPTLDNKQRFKLQHKIPKARVCPPGTYESYRPPAEYLPSEKTKAKYQRLRNIDRKEHFLPEQFDTLRHVPFYKHTIQDRYQRCLDLAFFPRRQRTRLVVDPSKLLPDLPDPKDLRPYPERLSFLYKGHTSTVRSISLSPNGQFLATGCDDHLVRVYEVLTGRLMKRYDVGGPVQQVEFSPAVTQNVLAVAVEFSIVFIVPAFCAHSAVNDRSISFLRSANATMNIDKAMAGPKAGATSAAAGSIVQTAQDKDETVYETAGDLHDVEQKEKRADFTDATAAETAAGIIIKVTMHAKVKKMTFHAKGDYMCALCPKDHVKYRQTVMLQLSKRKVFCPFRRFAEIVTDCKFHPREPLFFLSTTNSIRCYNLLAHRLQKRYKAPGGLTNCLSIHPDGDNFIIGDTTHHTVWYDCDFSDRPYKRMKSHKGVVNSVGYHGNTEAYPLFASGATDGQVHVFHGMVYDDYNKNAMIVPVKILRHARPVYSLTWHPTLPWVFTSTEDGTVSCWTE